MENHSYKKSLYSGLLLSTVSLMFATPFLSSGSIVHADNTPTTTQNSSSNSTNSLNINSGNNSSNGFNSNNGSNSNNTDNNVSNDNANFDTAVDGLSYAMEKAYQEGLKQDPSYTPEKAAKDVLTYTVTTPKNNQAQSPYSDSFFSIKGFGGCLFNDLGIGSATNLVKTIINRGVIYNLKRGSYRAAADLILSRLESHASGKIAKFAIKKISGYLVPGFGWGTLAWWLSSCAWKNR